MRVQLNDAHDAHKIQHIAGRCKARAAAGGHDVAGPGHVITQHFKGALANKYAAGIAHARRPVGGVGNAQAQVLGRKLIGQCHGCGYIRRDHNAAALRQRLRDHCLARQGLHAALQRGEHLRRQRCGVGEQDGGGKHIMLGLCQHVGSHPFRVGSRIGHHHGFSGARQPVKAHCPIQLLLRKRHKQSARPHNLVHARNGLRTVGHGRNCLRAAQLEHMLHAGQLCRSQDCASHALARRRGRGAHHNLFNAGHTRRQRGHQQRRSQRRAAARHINAHAPQRQHALAQLPAQRSAAPAARLLVLMKGADALRCKLQCGV